MNSTMKKKVRCPYFELNDQERAYHDKEWGTPCRNDRKLFEYLMYEVLQCGLSWNTVLLLEGMVADEKTVAVRWT